MFSLFKKAKKQEDLYTENVCKRPVFHKDVAKRILQTIKEEFGLDYSKQEHITMKKIERFALQNEIISFEELETLLNSSSNIKEELVNMLTVGETYFYRETGHFKILVNLMKERSVQNILCAPSSSGEEAYSIVLFLREHLKNPLNISVTGIDVNSESIQRAKEAKYSERSVSLLPKELREKYFQFDGKRYVLVEEIKHYTRFLQQNIFDDSLYNLGSFDVIFCRNMLIYFDDAQKKDVLQRLHKLLKKDGILFLGHADISFEPRGFEKQFTIDGSYYIKM